MEFGKAKQLRVSGAFHSSAMLPARAKLNNVLDQIKIALPTDTLVYSNVTGLPYKSAKEIRKNLSQHIVRPVLWHNTLDSLTKQENVTTLVECGPQQVLSKISEAYLKSESVDEESHHDMTIITSDS